MTGKRRLGQRTWRFSDSGNKFDGRPRSAPNAHVKPISPALKRGIIRCKRCGSRVVSNLDNCPFCGKSLKPFFARLWFWVIMVIVIAVVIIVFINTNLPEEKTAPDKPSDPVSAFVIGQDSQTSIKELSIGSTIQVGDLQVKVSSVSPGPIASNGSQLVMVFIEFNNQGDVEQTLYSTQWMMQSGDKKRVDTYVGTTLDGLTITSNFEAHSLAAGGRFTGRLYFAGEDLTEVVFQPSALAYSEDLLVTWQISELAINQTPEP